MHHDHDLSAPFASGSIRHDAFLILPASASTVGKIAAGIADTLITRAAMVAMKERMPLVIGLRETPLSTITLEALRTLPRVTQNTRHICIEGWDVIGSFGGVRLADLLTWVGAAPRARFVEIACADDYYESLDMAAARHPR